MFATGGAVFLKSQFFCGVDFIAASDVILTFTNRANQSHQ